MQRLRRSADRGFANHGWLRSWHSFSFADYYDPQHMGWGNLRVINEDRIAPGAGFGTHGHRDMEIISYVLAGELAHRDSMGHVHTLRAHELQRMSAGTGVTHSEYNHSTGQETHFLQIWIEPRQRAIEPGYELVRVCEDHLHGRLHLLASGCVVPGALTLNADAALYAGRFDGAQAARLALEPRRKACVHVVRGALCINGLTLAAGDALLLQEEAALQFEQGQQAEVLVFDLAP